MTSAVIPLSETSVSYWTGVLQQHSPGKGFTCRICFSTGGMCRYQLDANIAMASGGLSKLDFRTRTFVPQPAVTAEVNASPAKAARRVLHQCSACTKRRRAKHARKTKLTRSGRAWVQTRVPGSRPSQWHGWASAPDRGQIMAS